MKARDCFAAFVVATLVAFTLAPASAQAQDSDAEKAKKYYKKGIQAFHSEEYGMAITYLKRANSISPNSTLLFNISLAYSKMGKADEALPFAEKAAKRGGLPKDTTVKNLARINGYNVAIATQKMAESSSAQASNGGETGGGSGTGGNTGGGGGSGGGGQQPPPKSDSNTLTWVGISTGVVGLGMIGGAVAISNNVAAKIDEKETAVNNGRLDEADTLHSEIQSQQTLGQILLYSGIAAAAGGTVMAIIDASSGSSEGQAVNVTGGPTSRGFSVGLDVKF